MVDRDEQGDDVLPVGESELGAERNDVACEVAGCSFQLGAFADGDEVAARPQHARRRGEHLEGGEGLVPAARVLLPPVQQHRREGEEDQVDAAGGVHLQFGAVVLVAAQEPLRLFGEQPWQLGRIAAQDGRFAAWAFEAGVADPFQDDRDVADVVADDRERVSFLADRLDQGGAVVVAERVDDEVARLAVDRDRPAGDLRRRLVVVPEPLERLVRARPDRER